ncbi:hypothetical protein JK635_07320 [Neobacillus sp. YIM B02564]|uniref:Uncharacterized protein n=1 Tax=Neobacillus paridis TaxID=2803862 RepID=A0ABS1TN57_9BACI|nr:hypothetical protein [Neobacillus paridis]MBL4952018.1 hypothetical protein [Neobacillus paridis]
MELHKVERPLWSEKMLSPVLETTSVLEEAGQRNSSPIKEGRDKPEETLPCNRVPISSSKKNRPPLPLHSTIHRLESVVVYLNQAVELLKIGDFPSLLTYFDKSNGTFGDLISYLLNGDHSAEKLLIQYFNAFFKETDFFVERTPSPNKEFSLLFQDQPIGLIHIASRNVYIHVDIKDRLKRRDDILHEIEESEKAMDEKEKELKERLAEYQGMSLQFRHKQMMKRIKVELKDLPAQRELLKKKQEEIIRGCLLYKAMSEQLGKFANSVFSCGFQLQCFVEGQGFVCYQVL